MNDSATIFQFPSPAQPKEVLRLTMFGNIDALARKRWLVPGLLGDGELSCFVGAPGSGKSALATDLAAHVAAGREWFGRKLSPGTVLYVAAERDALVKRRLAALRDHRDMRDLPLAVLAGALDLRTSRAHADIVVEQANRLADESGLPIRLVIVDTISRALAGGDENSPRDMGSLVMNLAAIQAGTGAHVCCVHHVPVEGPLRLRGHGALLGALDTAITIEKTAAMRVATVTKANDGEEGPAVAFTMRGVTLWTDPESGESTTAPIVEPIPDDQPVPVASRKDKGPKIPKGAQIALNALREVVEKHGAPLAEPSPDVPADAKVVNLDQWREQAYARGIANSSNADAAKAEKAKREAFRRAREALSVAKKVAVWEPYVWLAS